MATLVITPEIEANAQKLAEATGTTPTEALANALRDKLVTVPKAAVGKATLENLDALLRRIHALPVDTTLTEDEILGYDDQGMPEQPYLGR